MATDKAEKSSPPYVSYKTFQTFLRSLAVAIPSRIDKSVMRSMSGAVQTQVLHALKYLGLIDANGVPQPKLPQLVKSEGPERQKVLQDILRAGYPFLSDPSFHIETATTAQLDERFSKLATGDTARKCKTFFLPAAKEAGLKVSPFIKEIGARSASNGTGKAKKARPPAPATSAGNAQQNESSPPPAPTMSWHELLLTKFPSFDPSWPDDVKAKWFTSFQQLMNKEGTK